MNKRRGAAFLYLALIFFVENAVSKAFPTGGALVISVLAFYALSEGPVFGVILGAYTGIFFELWGFGPFGYQIAGLAVLGAFCGSVSLQFFGDSPFTAVLLPVICLYLEACFNASLVNFAFQEGVWSALGRAFRPHDLLFAGIVSPFLFIVLDKISPKAAPARKRPYPR